MLLQKRLSPGAFNLIMGGVVLYGLLANVLISLLFRPFLQSLDLVGLVVGWLVSFFIGLFCARSQKLWLRILAFHLIVVPFGLLLSAVLGVYSGNQVLLAITMTAIITAGMILLSGCFPRFFERLGGVLLLSLCLTLVVSVVAWFMDFHLSLYSVVFISIFSLYIGYDWYKAQTCEKTLANAIDFAIDLYLDITNIFLDLLDLIDWLD